MKRRSLLQAVPAGLALAASAAPAPMKPPVAPRPPMGWNSFDAYDCAINEQQFRAVVDYMAKELLPFGWNYAVIDYIWFNPAPGNWNNPNRRFGHPDLRLNADGKPLDRLVMDAHGRLLPAVERFPSAAGGKGFRPIADYVHAKGLKFGIHIMRGIARQAYYENLPILGTKHTARDIAEPWDTCPWCNNMFGVDAAKPGAQAYYDSIFKLYAEWGVDFIKLDDLLHPVYHKGELELVHNAIEKCGRPMVLSLSPGEAPLSHARHLRRNSQMWRVSADFWDEWKALSHSFDLLNAWSPWIGPDSWPDGDMLPIGHLSLGGRPHGPDRMSQLTRPEHFTLLSLWCIARSPLMMGGDPLSSPEETLRLLKNTEVLAVNQESANNRQVSRDQHSAVWMADLPGSRDRYLALFNLSEERRRVSFTFEHEMLRGSHQVRDLWGGKDLGAHEKEFGAEIDPHGAGLYRLRRISGITGARR